MVYFNSLHMDLLIVCDGCKNYIPVREAIHRVIEFSTSSDGVIERINHVLCKDCYNSDVMKIPVGGKNNETRK